MNKKNKNISVFKTLPKVVFADKKRSKKSNGKEQNSLKIENIGEYIEGEGVYLGIYKPKDRDGDSLGRIFNLFAAKEDLGVVASYEDTIKQVKAIKNLGGHTGADFENENDLYTALTNNSYKGEWFIPTRAMIAEDNLIKDKDVVMPQGSLYGHINKGELKNSFNVIDNGRTNFADLYWSCTAQKHNPCNLFAVSFRSGNSWDNGSFYKFSTRLVRAVPRV